jgi:hypothetical protein
MENKYKNILLKRHRELRLHRHALIEPINKPETKIWKYYFIDDILDDEKCLKAQNELKLLKIEFKNVLGHIYALEKKYQFEFDPEELEDEDRNIPTPIEVPNDINDPYEIPNGLLGVNRDILNKLGTHRWAHGDDLQQMYGISQCAAGSWKDHFGFALKRPHKPKPDDK